MPNIFTEAEALPELREWLVDSSLPHAHVARQWGMSETSVRRWRTRHADALHTSAPEEPTTTDADEVQDSVAVTKGTVDVDSTGAQINNVVVTSPINDDWSSIFKLFNLNGDNFEVVDDTVRMSTWQQSKRTDSGERDTIQLWAYSARFRKISKDYIDPAKVDQWRADLIADRLPPAKALTETSGTYSIKVADPQLGKKGTEEAVENWKRGVATHVEEAERLIYQGFDLDAFHVAFMGDEHEGVVNNYTNQPHTVELNLSRQLELDYDMRVWTLREVSRLGLPIKATSVISNHGEWTRNGSKDVVTTRSDNSSTHIARQVQKLFAELEPFGGPAIDWEIGGSDGPGVLRTLSGVKSYFSHGYIEKGKGGSSEIKMRSAIERQILGRTDTHGDVPLWFMAHYHHFYQQEFEGRTQFGCPALEALRSSEYMQDQYGVWSPPGMLGMVIGRNKPRGWSNLNVY